MDQKKISLTKENRTHEHTHKKKLLLFPKKNHFLSFFLYSSTSLFFLKFSPEKKEEKKKRKEGTRRKEEEKVEYQRESELYLETPENRESNMAEKKSERDSLEKVVCTPASIFFLHRIIYLHLQNT